MNTTANNATAASFGYKLAFRKFGLETKLVLIEELNGVETILAVGRGAAFNTLNIPTAIILAAPVCELVEAQLPSCILELPAGN